MDIKLKTLKLVPFDKNNKEHILFLKKILNDKTITKRFSGFLSKLNSKSTNILNKAFFISDTNIIGFIDIGNFNQDEECVYLRGAIDKEKRGNNYGHRMLDEVSEYIFINYPEIKKIKLKIDNDNYSSIKTAESCSYTNLLNGYYAKRNPYIETFFK